MSEQVWQPTAYATAKETETDYCFRWQRDSLEIVYIWLDHTKRHVMQGFMCSYKGYVQPMGIRGENIIGNVLGP